MDKEFLEKIIPAGLTGPIRDKALDAALLANSLLHMSKEDIVNRVAEIAKEHGIDPTAGKSWILFYRDVNERLKHSELLGRIAKEPGAEALGIGYEADQYRARKSDERSAAHNTPSPSMTIPDVTGVAYIAAQGQDGDLVEAVRKEFSAEIGSHADSMSGRNGVFSWDQLATGWTGGQPGEHSGSGVGDVDIADAAPVRTVHDQLDSTLEPTIEDLQHGQSEHESAAQHQVETLHRKAATHLKDRDYIGFRTFLENAHLLDDEHKGRWKADGSQAPAERERISTHLMTNLLYTSEAGARGVQPDIMKAIRKLHDLPDPGPLGLDVRARDRMDKSIEQLTDDLRKRKETSRSRREAMDAKKRRAPCRDDSDLER
ncbi:hypothetical protein [Acidithiobacillus caldus]|uniref:hypothetical protein n=1 Tax=Acidithiobacillus caldus TaxID=33059 RepID=UPI001C0682A1|nr:hypothetical protein [Acidithiobacillus caldus]MBU2771596.1 hypothetical protein [Acidithiobacillus caldus]